MKSSIKLREPAPIAAPSHLTDEARDWFDRIVSEYGVSDEAGLLMLRSAMEAFDRANQAREILKREGLTVVDRYQQHRPHLAAGIQRDAEKCLLAFLRALNLDVEPVRPQVGRPGARR